ncbi:DUF983 domain-containing protein [Acuticoccus sp. MNP-M23]|uniref:DUF983 domain-containing protein n=1 Tax=Acuticoccus sp. MNP-M23 TaxID=3072793 RepID=UPI00281577CE|nr:DUF983 domain-containing protein [Acuticoccus sp. MNP-M23]WMS42733.1 DUF983 domain-containing protein [Acuticoccus sp. MNP-M23]
MMPRSMLRSLQRGASAKCPRCGEGPLFDGFLAIRHTCPSCGEALHHQRADDAPPYIVCFIVGHVVVGLMLYYEIFVHPPLWQHAAIFLPMTVILSLALLRPVKGGLVGFQWAKGMHGFGADSERWT